MRTYTLDRGQSRSKRWLYLIIVLVFVSGYLYWTLGRAVPLLKPTPNDIHFRAPAGKLVWPKVGQSAVGVVDSSILETHGKQMPVPTASTAKLITALVVLQVKPLQAGQQGPTITLAPSDVAIYNAYFVHDGSLVKVKAGEKISEYQMLEAMLLPSSNNMADSLAIWAFGSLKTYQQAANQYLEDNGLVESHVGSDASGFNPSTTSTAEDLVRIGELTMQDPVLAQIVALPGASHIPVAGSIRNVNFLLGVSNIIGIKTGNTDQAGGVYVSASKTQVNGKPVTIVTALAGSPTLFQALKDSLPLIRSAQANFKPVSVVKSGSIVGNYKLPWGGNVPVVASKDISLKAWSGSTVTAKAQLQKISVGNQAGQTVGNVAVPASAISNQISVPAKFKAAPTQPTVWWRLAHPFN